MSLLWLLMTRACSLPIIFSNNKKKIITPNCLVKLKINIFLTDMFEHIPIELKVSESVYTRTCQKEKMIEQFNTLKRRQIT